MTDAERTQRTFRLERWRAITAGILETAATTFLLLIAVKWFAAGSVAKALLAGGASVGLILSPLVVTWVTRRGWKASEAGAWILNAGAGGFFAAALVPWLPVYVAGGLVGLACASAAIPLLTQMYQENYPAPQRGRLFSRTVMIRIATAAIFSKVAGDFLAGNLPHFGWLLVVFGAASALGAWFLRRCPTRPIVDDGGSHPLRALRFVRDDALFRRTLVVWMLMGFANLMMLPLRVEYLANPRYGLRLPPDQVALYTGVIPNLARLVLSPIWGRLFDRMNFFALRATLNLGFAIGILSFFATNSTVGLVVGAIILGVSNAGGDVAWSLWVTKFAPPGRVADYMSVHTFFTGLRGVLAPVVAFQAALYLPLSALGWFCAALIALSSALLVPEIRSRRAAARATALVEEVAE